jgi:phage-related protein
MRMTGKDGISRAIYVTAKGRVVVVRVFVKRTQKTPRREIESRCKEPRRFRINETHDC